MIRDDIGDAPGCPCLRRQMRKVGFPVVRLAEQRAEFARTIGMNEIVALPVDDVDRLARQHRRPHAVECPPHIDIDHENAERLAVIGEDRRRDAYRRPVRLLDQSVAAPEIERRNVDLSGPERERFREIVSVASLLQSLFGNDPNRVVRSHAVDADNLTAVVIKADDPKHRIGGLGFEFRCKAGRYPVAPRLFGDAIDRVDAASLSGADQSLQRRRRTKARDISGRAGCVIFEVGRHLPRMRLDAVAGAQQQRLFQAAIAQPADRGNRDRDQRNHRDGKPGCERHFWFRSPSRPPRASGRANPAMLFRITGRKQHRRGHGMTMTTGVWRPPGSRRPSPAGPPV